MLIGVCQRELLSVRSLTLSAASSGQASLAPKPLHPWVALTTPLLRLRALLILCQTAQISALSQSYARRPAVA